MLFGLIKGRQHWRWRIGAVPSAAELAAAAAALRRPGAKAADEREAVLRHLADAAAHAATAAALCSCDLIDAAAEAAHPDAKPSQATVEAAAALATRLAAAPHAVAAALADSALLGSLAAALEAPSTAVSPDAKLDILACFRVAATRSAVRETMEREGAPAATVAALRAATEVGDWPLAGEAAWALEIMGGMSRRLTREIGEAEGVEAALELLQAARQQQPALRELPYDEEAAEAATTALHALLVLSTDNRRNRERLQRAGGAAELASAFQDERMGWEAREQAAGLLQDLAASLPQDGAAAAMEDDTAAVGGSGEVGFDRQAEWRETLLPALAAVLRQRRGQQLQESKEAAAGVIAKYAAHGPRHAADVREAGGLAPLVQLLGVGLQLAGGERRTAVAALQALQPLVGEPGCQEQLAGPCSTGVGQLDLLAPLHRALAEATAPELSLTALGAVGGPRQLAAAGWHAAAVTAALCAGGGSVTHQQELQEAAVARGLLPLLARFVEAQVPPPLAGGSSAAAPPGDSLLSPDFMAAVQCEVAGLLRSLSLRRSHHASLRACPGLVRRLRSLAEPGAHGWVELKACAKRILQNLGEIPDTDRPLLTYTPQQLGALLESQGVEPARFLERGVSGSEFVHLGEGELGGLAMGAPAQARVLRMLRAYDAFSEIDACGTRSGSLGLAKLAAYLGNRGFRQGELVPLAEALLALMDPDRDDAVSFPGFLQAYDEFLARTMADVQPPSKRRRTDSRLG
ncbi:vacuolar 8 [Micractinium conductrix]|uniref:Vacuolar 8 n=1 Tax=Micractinium conductrix TaxID=554055 RepID=A0A2P6VN55_9CHLO|nr:vacuolar 8 [Micractinium conductrix]|eukprot:PSC75524.1 vacuolar 8 [Micractinium conductrix]